MKALGGGLRLVCESLNSAFKFFCYVKYSYYFHLNKIKSIFIRLNALF
jgi:hypothetical protein